MNTLKSSSAFNNYTILVVLLFLSYLAIPCAYSSSLLTSRIQEYAAVYPDIHFLHVQGNDQGDDIIKLRKQLGEDAVNLDYEHDPIVRDDLLQLQFIRIKYLLGNGIPSATLFKTGKHAAYTRPYVCAITLDETLFLNHPDASAQFMLGDYARDSLPVKDLSSFDNNTFLLYTLDHEIYHCLDAYLHGPGMSKGSNEITAAYEHFLSEYRADLYASITTRQSYPSAIEFLRLLASYRIMGLVDFDTEHYTVAAIRQVIHMPVTRISNTGIAALAQSIRQLARSSAPGITDYSQLINAARGLALYLGSEDGGIDDAGKTTPNMATSPRLKLIIQEFEDARTHIITSNIYPGQD
jgi:hypothetical protein